MYVLRSGVNSTDDNREEGEQADEKKKSVTGRDLGVLRGTGSVKEYRPDGDALRIFQHADKRVATN